MVSYILQQLWVSLVHEIIDLMEFLPIHYSNGTAPLFGHFVGDIVIAPVFSLHCRILAMKVQPATKVSYSGSLCIG